MTKQNDKVLTFSKEGLERLKTISGVTNNSFIQREVFVQDAGRNMFLRATVIDIPDDFTMPVFDINEFISTYKMVDNPAVDYSKLDDKGFVKIFKNDDSKGSEFFKYFKREENLMGNNINIELEEKIISKFSDEKNSFTISKEKIARILKASSILDAKCITITPKDDVITIKTINPKTNKLNTNTFEIDIDNNVEIGLPDVDFNLEYILFAKIEKDVDEYDIHIRINEKGKKMLVIENKERGLCFYMGESNNI